jgi:phospholipid/cholesterol/gamma-HCH transport system substrate-binding protein
LIVLAAWGAVQIAQRHWHWKPTFEARAEFTRIGGLAVGDRVRLQGMDAGVVEAIEAPITPGGPIRVRMRLDQRLRHLIRGDALASIIAPSVVGPKVVEIAPGEPDAPPLPPDGLLRSASPIELSDLLESGQAALVRVEEMAAQSAIGVAQINEIAQRINRGEGTLGKLVRDDDAYRQLMSLARRGEVAVTSIGDSMTAMRGVWPFSNLTKERGYDDPQRVLYRPNATREPRVFNADRLFDPNSAILTVDGKAQLDEFARWFKERKPLESVEVVIAAFTDRGRDPDAARILTEDQARAVKSYLQETHRLFELPLFRQRKVAAVGFGTERPRPDPDAGSPADPELPPRRVEVILFTPRA